MKKLTKTKLFHYHDIFKKAHIFMIDNIKIDKNLIKKLVSTFMKDTFLLDIRLNKEDDLFKKIKKKNIKHLISPSDKSDENVDLIILFSKKDVSLLDDIKENELEFSVLLDDNNINWNQTFYNRREYIKYAFKIKSDFGIYISNKENEIIISYNYKKFNDKVLSDKIKKFINAWKGI